MKDLLLAAAIVALSLGVVAAAVFGLNDDDTFVSPPEIVAEEFVRAVVHGRAAAARGFLASEDERVTSVEHLLRISRDTRRRYGTVDDISEKGAQRSGNRAVARVVMRGSRAQEEVLIPTVRERGEWKVAVPVGLMTSAQPQRPR